MGNDLTMKQGMAALVGSFVAYPVPVHLTAGLLPPCAGRATQA
jgi:hypothetical protein